MLITVTFLTEVFFIFCLSWHIVSSGTLCRRNPTSSHYGCEPIPANITKIQDLPPNTCGIQSCRHCVTSKRSFILTEDGDLLEPSFFFDRPTGISGNTSTFVCAIRDNPGGDETMIPCDCAQNCTGSDEFCAMVQCDPTAACGCVVDQVQYELQHITATDTIMNPTLLTIDVCLYRLPSHTKTVRRRLLEYESASFSQHNLTVIFNDPVVSVPEPGKLIARVAGKEIIFDVTNDFNVVFPFEFVAYKRQLTLIQ